MAIRKNTNPRATDLQPGLRDILLRNGMQAHVVMDGGSYKLLVQGHESPLLSYTLTDRQVQALTDWGTNYADKKAYRTFTDIVGGDFTCPAVSYMRGMPTDVWRWGCTATASEQVNTDVQAGLRHSWDGRRDSREGGTCAG